jgi:putative glycosyltransferase (TIGR04372 family)
MPVALFRLRKIVRRSLRSVLRRTIGAGSTVLRKSRSVRVLALRLARTGVGQHVALRLLLRVNARMRRRGVSGLLRSYPDKALRLRFFALAKARYAARQDFPNADAFVQAAIACERVLEARHALASLPPHLTSPAIENKLIPASLEAAYEFADYAGALKWANRGASVRPAALRARFDFLKAAFAAGKLLDTKTALAMCARQFQPVYEWESFSPDEERRHFFEQIVKTCVHACRDELALDFLEENNNRRYGVFFLTATQALGHAVLDPYHFLAMNRGRFDRILLIGPPRPAWSPASRTALKIIEQYATYCETESDLLQNLSWQYLGEIVHGRMTIVVEHYWSLLRAVVHRSRDAADPFHHNAWHLRIPDAMAAAGAWTCKHIGIDLERPLVVLHARHSAYHGIGKQAFRDAPIESYREAIELLLRKGYQVVRIGDRKMPRLALKHERYVELPFVPGYFNALDPFLISRAAFMIGCQSGPCAFARAFGVPLLSVNAVLHYTLLPSPREMACFKRYFITESGERREMPLAEALSRGVQFLDNGHQFEAAGIEVATVQPGDIDAAVAEMLAWLDQPDRPETPEQRAFREQVAAVADDLARNGNPRLPLADFVGFSLPGYRLAPVAASAAAERGPGLAVPAVEAPPEPVVATRR